MEPTVHQVVSGDVTLTVQEYGERFRGTGAATVVFLPAMGVPLAYYRPMFEHWAERKRPVLGLELRGMPQSPVAGFPRTPFGYRHLIRDDLPAVFELEPIAAADDVVLVGHSLGGHLSLLAAAAGTVRVRALVTIGTGTSSAASQLSRSGRLVRRAQLGAVRAVIRVLGYWPGHRLGFGGRQPRMMMADWAFEGRHGRYRLTGDPTDFEAALAGLELPKLLLALDGDQYVPARAVEHLTARLAGGPGPTAERTVSRPGGRLDHFSWARRTPELVIDEVETWLAETGL